MSLRSQTKCSTEAGGAAVGRPGLLAACAAGLGLAFLWGSAQGAAGLNCSIADPGPITAGTPVTFTGTLSGGNPPYAVTWTFQDATPPKVTTPTVQPGNTTASATFNSQGQKNVSLSATDTPKGKSKPATCSPSRTVTVSPTPPKPGAAPTARGDTYATPVGKTLKVTASSVSGVLYNDFYTDPATGKQVFNSGLTAVNFSSPANGGTVVPDSNGDGGFTYTPPSGLGDNSDDSFTYQAKDASGRLSDVTKVNIHILSDQPDFKIMMNYELGMHCTGFEFSYCCILPPYNSIVAQVVKPQQSASPSSNADYPRLLRGDPDNGLDGLSRETVLRDYDSAGNFKKYFLEYFHDAMPRREGNSSHLQVAGPTVPGYEGHEATLISAAEGNSLLYYSTPYDSAMVDKTGSITGVPGKLVRGTYAGIPNVVLGNGSYKDPTDNFANGWLNHLYIYANAQGKPNLEGENASGGSLERDKIRLGVTGMVQYPTDCGPSLQPLGPVTRVEPLSPANTATKSNDCGGASNGNVLTFSGDTGTIVYTQMKVLENLPITLTAPGIWEALGMPLTPFEDSLCFFAEDPNNPKCGPGSLDEDAIRPFVAMKARLINANCDAQGHCTKGSVVMGSNGKPVIGFGAAPIDIPNCERCHGAPSINPTTKKPNLNSPNWIRRPGGPDPFYGPGFQTLEALTDLEIEYWKTVYPSLTTGSDWYARLKGAAINMVSMHDYDIGTDFSANYPTPESTTCWASRPRSLFSRTRVLAMSR